MADGTDDLGQDEVEELLRHAAGQTPDTEKKPGPDQAEDISQQATGSNPAAPATDELGQIDPSAEPDTEPTGNVTTDQTVEPQPTAPDDDVELLLAQAEEALRSIDVPNQGEVEGLAPFELKDLTGSRPNTQKASLSLLRDVELDLRIELGRTHMYLEDVLNLRKGTVVPLDKLAGDPVDIYVNGRLVARGEILVLNDNFCVRVADLVSGEELA